LTYGQNPHQKLSKQFFPTRPFLIESGEPLDAEQIQAFARVIKTELTILGEELRGNCSTTDNAYPKNLTLANFIDWSWLPTLVYELEHPRQEKRSWTCIAEKSVKGHDTLGNIIFWIGIFIGPSLIASLYLIV
jgi:sterol O-acyltransferase